MVVRAGQQDQSSDAGSQELLASRVREAFSKPLNDEAVDLFVNGREGGLDWEHATRAVVEGTARRFGSPDIQLRPSPKPRRKHRLWTGFLFGLLLYLAVKPALSLAHEATVAVLAQALQRFGASGVWQPLISLLGLDPIYSDGALRSLGVVQVLGLAIASPIGWLAQRVWPGVFLTPDLVQTGGAVSLIVAPGASLLARAASAVGADIAWLSLGLLLTRQARGRMWLAALGLLVQAEIVVGYLAHGQVGAADVDAAGLPFALSIVSPGAGWYATDQLGRLPGWLQGATLGLGFIAFAYSGASAVLLLAGFAQRTQPTPSVVQPPGSPSADAS